MVKNKKSVRKNKDNKKVDIDKEIDEILKLGNVEDVSSQNQDDNIISNGEWEENKKRFSDYKEHHIKESRDIYKDFLNKKIKGINYFNEDYKINNGYVDVGWNYFLTIENIKGHIRELNINASYTDVKCIKHLSLKWYVKNFWNKYNPISLYKTIKLKKDYDNDINGALYNAGVIEENPFKNKNEYKSSLTDKIKWFGHNLLHCQCSDREEKSCDIDIDEIIKNNSYEGIKEYEKEKDKLFELQEQVRSILEIMDNKEYPLFEYKINEDRTYRPYFSDKWEKRLTELGYKGYVKEDLERFIRENNG